MKEQFAAASALIKAKRYNEARKLLKTINHPKAKEWLAKLDTIAPIKTRKSWRWLFVGLAVIATCILAAFIFQQWQRHQYIEERRIGVSVDLKLYCEVTTTRSDVACEQYGDDIAANDDYAWWGIICGMYNPLSETDLYQSCLIRNNVPLP